MNILVLWSPEQPVPEGQESGGVEGTDEDEQQKVETHHDGEVVPEEPWPAVGTPEGEKDFILAIM